MLGQTIEKVVPVTIALALIFSVLAHFWACNDAAPWWRKRELVTDIVYWFFVPVFARVIRIGLLVVGASLVFHINDADELIAFYDNGHGPLSQLPLWAQAILFVVLADFMLYWLHRLFHPRALEIPRGPSFFRGTGLDLGGALPSDQPDHRHHLGRRHSADGGHLPNVMLWVGPFNTFHSAFVHANLNWTLGPFKYVLATPVFHRWHHTALEAGGNTNFAGTFPLWDILFGTFRMPENELPENYGKDEAAMPSEIVGQLVFPFRRN